MSHAPHPKQLKYCENCGSQDDLWYYKHVHNGITLCEDCGWLPYSKVEKKEVNWIEVNGEYYPEDLNKALKGKLC